MSGIIRYLMESGIIRALNRNEYREICYGQEFISIKD